MYANFMHSPPLSQQPAFDIIGDVVWDDLNDLRKFGKNGIFNAWTIKWDGNSPGGYAAAGNR